MTAISTLAPSVGLATPYSPALNEAQSAARARSTINSMPVASTINHLSHVLGGIKLNLGAGSVAAGDTVPVPRPDTQAEQAARRYAEIEATTRAAANAPDGRAE